MEKRICIPMKSTMMEDGVSDIDKEGVKLLLGISQIVSKEIANSKSNRIFDDDEESDDADRVSPPFIINDNEDDNMYGWQRIRTVSIDHDSPKQQPKRHTTLTGVIEENEEIGGIESFSLASSKTGMVPSRIYTPLSLNNNNNKVLAAPSCLRKVKKPTSRAPVVRKVVTKKSKKRKHASSSSSRVNVALSNAALTSAIMAKHNKKALEENIVNGNSGEVKVINRKKFSWKNYPELEAFLVCNREEYLRHSAMNYTAQQKHYNNRLTERLLDLAATHRYVFEEHEFDFVAVRDRIRCFYKSYVQSSKKKGIVVGYAARKAGILSATELYQSAKKAGKIFTPSDL